MRSNKSEKDVGGKERGLGATYYFYHNVNKTNSSQENKTLTKRKKLKRE